MTYRPMPIPSCLSGPSFTRSSFIVTTRMLFGSDTETQTQTLSNDTVIRYIATEHYNCLVAVYNVMEKLPRLGQVEDTENEAINVDHSQPAGNDE